MESKPLIVAPAVSVIVAELGRRPAWQHGEPFTVPASLWKAASEEMEAIMLKRGFKLPVSKAVRAEHFLIQGTPILAHG